MAEHYFTGKPCKNGHIAKRFVSNWQCVECGKAHTRAYRKRYPARVLAQEQKWRKENPEKTNGYHKQWKQNHKQQVRASQAKYMRNRRTSDPTFKLQGALRDRIRHALNGQYRSSTAIKYLGCSAAELKAHLEAQFKPGMTWENWSLHGWHIDHIRPLAAFDLTDPAQLAEACHYTNLQPLWATDNLKKGRK